MSTQIAGGDAGAEGTGAERLLGYSNYLLGNDPARWHTNVPRFESVIYDDVYPGTDWAVLLDLV